MMWSTRGAKISSVLAAATALWIGAAGTASAASGTGLDGTDPIATGCSTGATTVATAPVVQWNNGANAGTLEVRYSASCGTNWVRYTPPTNWVNVYAYKSISRPAQGSLPAASYEDTDPTSVGASYGRQVYAPGSTCVDVSVELMAAPYTYVYASTGTSSNPWIQVC